MTDALDLVNTPRLQGGTFTKVFSNAAMHWILRAPAGRQADFLRGVRGALAPGGAFAFEMGGLGNVAEVRAALLAAVARRCSRVGEGEGAGGDGLGSGLALARARDPWFFPDEAWAAAALGPAAGWRVERVEREYRPTPVADGRGGVEGWVRLMGARFLEAVEEGAEREACVREVVDVLETVCRNPAGGFTFGYVRLRVLARKI